MDFGVKYLNGSTVKSNGIGQSLYRLSGKISVSQGLPNVNLISSSLGRKTQYFSCTGGIL